MAGRNQGNSASFFWELQGFRVAYVEIRKAPTAREPGRRIRVVGLEDGRDHHVCSECGKHHGEGVSQEWDARMWRDCSLGDFETYVEIVPWRVACCGGTRVESFPWEADGHRMTRRFFERLAALCTRLPVSEVAKMANLSWDTVARVDKEAIKLGLGGTEPDLGKLRWIGVDEVSRNGGRVYFTVITNLESGAVVHIGDGKGEAGLRSFLDRLPNRLRKRIRGTTSDLGYLSLLKKAFHNAVHILDRFHIVKWVNDALNQLRRQEYGGAPRTEGGKVVKAKKWLLLSARERLDQGHKVVLARLMKLNRRIYRAYLLKEQLREILHYPWRYFGALQRNLKAWCRSVMYSRIEPLKKVARRLRPHMEAIVEAFKHDIKMGLVEEVNGKIVKLRRSAHGYRDREYFKLKIFQRCSLPSNPWAHIVL